MKNEGKYKILEIIVRSNELPSASEIARTLGYQREWVRQALGWWDKKKYITKLPKGKYELNIRSAKKLNKNLNRPTWKN